MKNRTNMMKTITLAMLGGLILSDVAYAVMEDDPLLATVTIEQLEWRSANGDDPWVWDAEGWVGKDFHKLWFKSEGEAVDGRTESAFLEALYSRAIATYWDLQTGWRHDFEPGPSRDWFAIGFQGVAPYFFEVDATLYAGGNGTVAARLEAEYEILFTQRLILTPEVEFNAYGRDDPPRGIGSGVSDLELGLRLRYEIRRQLAPYIGINWEKKFGGTADFARAEGESSDDLQFVIGLRAWF